eukprot:356022-Chlamydomonas_euryale.AAC.4
MCSTYGFLSLSSCGFASPACWISPDGGRAGQRGARDHVNRHCCSLRACRSRLAREEPDGARHAVNFSHPSPEGLGAALLLLPHTSPHERTNVTPGVRRSQASVEGHTTHFACRAPPSPQID